jgi:Cu(I)/Ag(I) efflux system protein CusF
MRILSVLAAALLLASAPAFAQHAHADAQKGAATSKDLADGEVRKVDKAAGKITLKHGPIPSIEMPPMTMVFKVKEPAMLDKVKAGDTVKFKAESVNGAFTVTEIQPAK